MTYRREDYQRLFQVQSGAVPFFAADIWGQYYKKLEAIQTYQNGVWTSYIPNRVMKQTLKDGLKLYTNREAFEKYRNDFKSYKRESESFFEEVLAKNELLVEEVERFFKLATKLFVFYSKVDFFYTDLAFAESKKENNKLLKSNLSELDAIKNPGREYLNAVFFGNDSYLFKIIRKIANQFNLDFQTLLGFSADEIIKLFLGKIQKDRVAQDRLDAFVIIGLGKSEEYLAAEQAKDFILGFQKINREQGATIFKGICANPGQVIGKAKVVPSTYYYDFKILAEIIADMEQGDILVAETTSPELMPAIKKAAGIITNQGGLLSHAAIVSREMGIPCIVGIDGITQIIKDGMTIEVDANVGVVKMIEG